MVVAVNSKQDPTRTDNKIHENIPEIIGSK